MCLLQLVAIPIKQASIERCCVFIAVPFNYFEFVVRKLDNYRMDNELIAKSLEQLADLMEFQGTNAFRLKAYRNGAKAVRELTSPIGSLLSENEDLTQFAGIGKSVAQKCTELHETGSLQQLEDLLKEVPRSVLGLLNIPKLGPKKAAALFNELGISDLDQLKAACEAQKVRELDGFAEKTEQAILDGIAIAEAAGQRIRWAEADQLVGRLREHMSQCPAVKQAEYAGSYRRGKETVGDLDLLVTSEQAEVVMDHFATYPEVASTIARGGTKMSVRTGEEFQIDLRVVPDESFGAALQYFTGSKEHNVIVRGLAKQAGLRVNEWGVYKLDGDDSKWIAGRTEEEVYESLGLPTFQPEIRESRREFEFANKGNLPEPLEVQDIQGDLHMHTTATDGKNSIEEMAAAARARGLKFIAITDHSKRVSVANGLDEGRVLEQWATIDEINQKSEDDFLILKGIECDILEAGGMDLPDSVLSQADWVIASLHYGQKQTRNQITDRILGALETEFVCMLAHPTGRLINRRPPYDVDLEAVFQSAVENKKFLELNAAPKRLDLHDLHLLAAKEAGVSIGINTDAHNIGSLDNLKYGIKQARRGTLQASDVANTRSWPEMLAMLGRS